MKGGSPWGQAEGHGEGGRWGRSACLEDLGLAGALGEHQLTELAESAEDDDADVGLGQLHDLGDLVVRELGVELEGDDVLLALGELADEASDSALLFSGEDLRLDGCRARRDFAHYVRIDERL